MQSYNFQQLQNLSENFHILYQVHCKFIHTCWNSMLMEEAVELAIVPKAVWDKTKVVPVKEGEDGIPKA